MEYLSYNNSLSSVGKIHFVYYLGKEIELKLSPTSKYLLFK